MSSRRISKQELDRLFEKERQAEQGHKIKKVIYGPDGKPLNNRKRKGASKAMMQQAIVSKLYEDGFIVKENDMFKIDASDKLEKTYGEGKTADIRAILGQLVYGLHKTGVVVVVCGIRWEVTSLDSEAPEAKEIITKLSGKLQDTGGIDP